MPAPAKTERFFGVERTQGSGWVSLPGYVYATRRAAEAACDGLRAVSHPSALLRVRETAVVEGHGLQPMLARLGLEAIPGRFEGSRRILRGGVEVFEGRAHDVWIWLHSHPVQWSGVFRGTDSDPRECGWCETCAREVFDGEAGHTKAPRRPLADGCDPVSLTNEEVL